jgi:hypothetical protein
VHLLPLDEAAAHYLIDRRFDEGGADRFPLPVPLTVVGDGFLIVSNVCLELCLARRQLFCWCGLVPNQLQVHEHVGQALQGFLDIAVPQQVLDALQKPKVLDLLAKLNNIVANSDKSCLGP